MERRLGPPHACLESECETSLQLDTESTYVALPAHPILQVVWSEATTAPSMSVLPQSRRGVARQLVAEAMT